jgi:hypothetical protein
MSNASIDPTKTQFTRLRNVDCPYCGVPLDKANRTRDHVIGMNFVPPGAFAGEWNLIVGACKACNGEKSGLEDDISAITLLSEVAGSQANVPPGIAKRASEKAAKSRSRLTGKKVADSSEGLKFSFQRYGATISFGLVAPPQIHANRSARLAWMNLRGFTYFVGYDETKKTSIPGPADMVIVSEASRLDWGNVSQVAFAKHVATWGPRLVATTAAGYFRVAIRRDPANLCWSWALEWNKERRLVGFFGDPDPIRVNERAIPQPKRMLLEKLPDGGFRTHYQETQLAHADDILFA